MHILRDDCETDRERALWDKCESLGQDVAWLQGRLARINAVFFGDLHRGIEAVIDNLRGKYFGDALEHQPDSDVERAVQARSVALARCHRRSLSDAARKQAIEHARSLGALPADFDEAALPWRERPSLTPEPGPDEQLAALAEEPPPQPAKDPMRVRYLIEAADAIPKRGSPACDLLIAGRLARLSGHWRVLKNSLLATWRQIRRSGGGIPRGATYSDGIRAADEDRILYRAGGPETPQWTAWSSTLTYYPTPDQVVAVEHDLWRYPDSTIARDGPRFYAPGQPMVPRIDLELSTSWKEIMSTAKKQAKKRDIAPPEAWRKLPKELRALAALELQLRKPRKRR